MHKLSFNNIFIPRKLNEIEEKEKQRLQLLLQQEVIDGDLNLSNSEWTKDLGNIKNVRGSLNLYNSSIQTLSNLKYVGGNLDLRYAPIQSLGNLEHVGGWLDLTLTPIQSLGNLKYVGEDLTLYKSQIKDLSNLRYVGSDLRLHYTPLSKQFSNKQELEQYVRNKVEVKGSIYA